MDEPVRRRRRVRHPPAEAPARAEPPAPAEPPARAEPPAPVEPPVPAGPPRREMPERPVPPRHQSALDPPLTEWPGDANEQPQNERGLRGLVGGGSSQVSVSAALRARDAARPSAEELAHAEEHLVIVRRHWTPH